MKNLGFITSLLVVIGIICPYGESTTPTSVPPLSPAKPDELKKCPDDSDCGKACLLTQRKYMEDDKIQFDKFEDYLDNLVPKDAPYELVFAGEYLNQLTSCIQKANAMDDKCKVASTLYECAPVIFVRTLQNLHDSLGSTANDENSSNQHAR